MAGKVREGMRNPRDAIAPECERADGAATVRPCGTNDLSQWPWAIVAPADAQT